MADYIQFDFYPNPNPDKEKKDAGYHVRINNNTIVDDKEISARLERECTLTKADIAAVLVGLRGVVVDALAHGNVVSLDGICKIEPILGVNNGECKGDEDGSQITLKTIRLQPWKSLKDEVNTQLRPRVRKKGRHSVALTETDMNDKLTEYFRKHDTVARCDIEEMFGLTRYMATKYIDKFVADGCLLAPRFRNGAEYKPAPGYFGREKGK